MSHLLQLPSELRQSILLEALPTHIDVSKETASPFGDILLICKSLREDVLEIIKQHEPIYTVRDPAHLRYVRRLKHVAHVKLDIFAPSTIPNLREHVFPPWEAPTLQLLIEKWSGKIARLPKSGLKSVTVDISPVPGYGRERNQEWISFLVNDPKISNKLFNRHNHDIASLVGIVGTRLGQADDAKKKEGVTVIISGSMSRKTGERIPRVLESLERLRSQGFITHFEPHYLDDTDVPRFEKMLNPLIMADLDVEPRFQDEWKLVKKRVRRALERDKGLRQIFYKNEIKNEEWTIHAIQRLARFAIGQLAEHETSAAVKTDGEVESITFEFLEPLKRAWVHQVARVLKMDTCSEGERVEGRVVFKSVKVWKGKHWCG
jgi:hypothetical protein